MAVVGGPAGLIDIRAVRALIAVTLLFALQWAWQTCNVYMPVMPVLTVNQVPVPSSWYIHNITACAVYMVLAVAAPRIQPLIRKVGVWLFAGGCLILSTVLRVACPAVGAEASFQIAIFPILLADIGSGIFTALRFDLFLAVADSRLRGFVVLAGTALQMLVALVVRSVPDLAGQALLIVLVPVMVLAAHRACSGLDFLGLKSTGIWPDAFGTRRVGKEVHPSQIAALFLLAVVLNAIRSVADDMGDGSTSEEPWVLGVTFLIVMAVTVAALVVGLRFVDRVLPISVALLMVGVAGITLTGISHSLLAMAFSTAGYYLFGALFWLTTAEYASRHPERSVRTAALMHILLTLGLLIGNVLYRMFGTTPASSFWMLLITNVAMIATLIFVMRGDGAVRGDGNRARTADLQKVLAVDCDALAREYGLTKREGEILVYLAAGRGVRTIAESCCLSENTVKTHVAHIYQKIGVHSREELMLLVVPDGCRRNEAPSSV